MEEQAQKEQQPANHFKNEAWEWIKAIFIAAGLVYFIRLFIFAPFLVEGPSMQPTLHTGERLIVNKLVYDIRAPKRGEIIVFHAPEGKDYIKRIIALPGETVKVEGDQVYIDGELLTELYIQGEIEEARKMGEDYNTLIDFKVTDNGVKEEKVPPGTLFVMGDYRPNSKDSRFEEVGFVNYDKVVGRAEFIFWPLPDVEWISYSYGVKR